MLNLHQHYHFWNFYWEDIVNKTGHFSGSVFYTTRLARLFMSFTLTSATRFICLIGERTFLNNAFCLARRFPRTSNFNRWHLCY